jgi:hypothetical protein
MRPALLALMMTAFAAVARADAPAAKPLLHGTFEVTHVHDRSGTEQEIPRQLLTGSTVWARWTFTFDGDALTVSVAVLDKDAGRYRSCEVSISTDVVWSATGFTVPARVATSASAIDFGQLDAKAFRGDRKGCTAHVEKGMFTVVAGKAPRLEQSGDVLYLAPSAEEPGHLDWRKHVP